MGGSWIENGLLQRKRESSLGSRLEGVNETAMSETNQSENEFGKHAFRAAPFKGDATAATAAAERCYTLTARPTRC